jgi:hypothetical protein
MRIGRAICFGICLVSFFSSCTVYVPADACSGFELRVQRLSLSNASPIDSMAAVGSVTPPSGRYFSAPKIMDGALGESRAIKAVSATQYLPSEPAQTYGGQKVYAAGSLIGRVLGLEASAQCLNAKQLGWQHACVSGSDPIIVDDEGAFELDGAGGLRQIEGWTGSAQQWANRGASSWGDGLFYLDNAAKTTVWDRCDRRGKLISSSDLPVNTWDWSYRPRSTDGAFFVGTREAEINASTGRDSYLYSFFMIANGGSAVPGLSWSAESPNRWSLVGTTEKGFFFLEGDKGEILGSAATFQLASSFAEVATPHSVTMGPYADSPFAVAPSSIMEYPDGLSAGGKIALYDSNLALISTVDIPACSGYLSGIAITGSYAAIIEIIPSSPTTITISQNQGF